MVTSSLSAFPSFAPNFTSRFCSFGVTGTLADPKLEIYSGATKINENDNWAGTPDLTAAFNAVGAFGLPAPT